MIFFEQPSLILKEEFSLVTILIFTFLFLITLGDFFNGWVLNFFYYVMLIQMLIWWEMVRFIMTEISSYFQKDRETYNYIAGAPALQCGVLTGLFVAGVIGGGLYRLWNLLKRNGGSVEVVIEGASTLVALPPLITPAVSKEAHQFFFHIKIAPVDFNMKRIYADYRECLLIIGKFIRAHPIILTGVIIIPGIFELVFGDRYFSNLLTRLWSSPLLDSLRRRISRGFSNFFSGIWNWSIFDSLRGGITRFFSNLNNVISRWSLTDYLKRWNSSFSEWLNKIMEQPFKEHLPRWLFTSLGSIPKPVYLVILTTLAILSICLWGR